MGAQKDGQIYKRQISTFLNLQKFDGDAGFELFALLVERILPLTPNEVVWTQR